MAAVKEKLSFTTISSSFMILYMRKTDLFRFINFSLIYAWGKKLKLEDYGLVLHWFGLVFLSCFKQKLY